MQSIPYPFAETTLTLAGREWRITAVEDQDALLKGVTTDADLANFPYGLMLWASAVGLCEWLAEHPETVRGRRVLEIGAGVGLAGLVAAWLGAAEVVQTDYQTDALALCRRNAAANGITSGISVCQGDWRDFRADLTGFPVVLGSDILYERSLHPVLADLLPRLVAPAGSLLLADPIRPQALDFLERMERQAGWRAVFDGRRVHWRGEVKDIALVRVSFDN